MTDNAHELEHVSGAKGGSQQSRTPVESPDSLQSLAIARILDLVSEGEIEGFADPAKPLTCVFLDETPLANPDGSLNFKNVHVETRAGTLTQSYIPGFASVENEIAIAVEFKASQSWTRAFTNLNLSAVNVRLSVPALTKQNTSNGDITGHTVSYLIEVATDGGAFQEAVWGAFSGKTTTKYERRHRIDLPRALTGWTIRVRRLTADTTASNIQDATFVESVTEVIDAKLRYPMSALVGITVDASQFRNIPTRGYRLRGRRVRVPSNYNPTTRVYTGIWDGTFMPAWTNNPAWVYLDMVTHRRYGLGHIVSDAMVDKWSLYKIARYCDELVPDGKGGTEPRFHCNLYLQQRAEAYRVLQDMASIFRGIAFWTGGSIIAAADIPQDPVYTYTNANVVEGQFTYSGSAKRARHTVALVAWSDPDDFGRAKVEYVEDDEAVARYGVIPTEVTAIGATSQGMARRIGKWILLTEKLETDTVTFSIGLDGTFAVPGQVVRIADEKRAGKRIGGRVSGSPALDTIILDRLPEPAPAAGDTLTLILPAGTPETRVIASVDSIAGSVSTTAPFTSAPVDGGIWTIESAALQAQLFRIISVVEGEGLTFTVTALQHNASKFAAVDFDEPVQVPPTSVIPSPVVPAPTGVTLAFFERASEYIAQPVIRSDWDAIPGAVAYQVQWRKDDGEWSSPQRTSSNSAEFENAFPGTYRISVATVWVGGRVSPPTIPAALVVESTVPPTYVEYIGTVASDALLAAANAQAAADGTIDIFRQESAPTVAKFGDYWQRVSTGQWYVNTSTGSTPAWSDATDTRIPESLTAASNAQATANSKNRIHYSETQPASGYQLFDLWVKPSTEEIFQYNGSGWSKVAENSQSHLTRYVANPSFELPLSVGWFDVYGNGATGWYTEAGGFTGSRRLVKYAGVNGSSGLFQQAAAGGLAMPVSAGQRVSVVYTAWCNGVSAGELAIGAAFYDSTGANVNNDSWAPGATGNVSAAIGTGGTWKTFRKVITAPANAQSARLVIAAHGYAGIGAWAIDNVSIAPELQSLDEIPNGATNSSVLTSQVQNGVLPPYSFGEELVGNGSFELVAAGGGSASAAVGAVMADGWQILEVGGTLQFTAAVEANNSPRTGIRAQFIGNEAGNASPGYNYTIVGTKQTFPTAEGERFIIRTGIREDYAAAIPANITREVFVGLRFYTAAGAYVGQGGALYQDTSASGRNIPSAMSVTSGRVEKTLVAPAGAAIARPIFYVAAINSTGAPIACAWAVTHVRIDDFSARRISSASTGANMLRNSEFGLGATAWGNVGTITSVQDGKRMTYGPLGAGATAVPYQDVTFATTLPKGSPLSASVEVILGGLAADAQAYLEIQTNSPTAGWRSLGYSNIVRAANLASNGIAKLEINGVEIVDADINTVRWLTVFVGAASSCQFRKPKLERGLIVTPYVEDEAGVYGTELTQRGSRRLLGGPRNIPVGQTMGAGSIRTTTALSANSSGQVSVAAHSVELNGETVSYSAVSNAVVGLTQNLTYVIYTLDPYADGGSRTWYAAATYLAAQTAGEGVVIAGEILIPTSGTSTGGQGGNGDPGDFCVGMDTVLPDGRLVRELRPGDLVPCVDVTAPVLCVEMHPVVSIDFGAELCYRLVSDCGASIVQSASTPMTIPDGRTLRTPEMFGRPVVNGGLETRQVCDLVRLDVRPVVKLNVGGRMYLAGERAEATLATHNANAKP
jgi:predicted phage tail protein